MQSILVSDISLGDRRRAVRSEGKIRELKRSITQDGLLFPIVLTDDHRLVAGFHRLMAVMELVAEGVAIRYRGKSVEPGCIPFLYEKAVEERAVLRAELEERLRGGDLTPVGRASAVTRLHEIYAMQAEGPWSTGDTARRLRELKALNVEAGMAKAQVSRAFLISRFADDPDVAAAQTDRDAYSAACKKNEAALAAALGVSNDEILSETFMDKLIE